MKTLFLWNPPPTIVLMERIHLLRKAEIVKDTFKIVIVSAIVSVGAFCAMPHEKISGQGALKQGVFERITETRELHCGYINYPPLLTKNPNSGTFSGISVDIMNRIADILRVRLTWVEETSWAAYIEGLNSGRFDVLCTLDFFMPEYTGRIDVSRPLFFTSIGAYARAGDGRFTKSDMKFNDPSLTISALDGSISMMIKNTDYPDAKLISMPAATDYSFILTNVATKKADVAFVERAVANAWGHANPGRIVAINERTPLRIFPYIIPFKFGETNLKMAMDEAVQYLVNNGEIDRILSKYENKETDFYRVAREYQQSAAKNEGTAIGRN